MQFFLILTVQTKVIPAGKICEENRSVDSMTVGNAGVWVAADVLLMLHELIPRYCQIHTNEQKSV